MGEEEGDDVRGADAFDCSSGISSDGSSSFHSSPRRHPDPRHRRPHRIISHGGTGARRGPDGVGVPYAGFSHGRVVCLCRTGGGVSHETMQGVRENVPLVFLFLLFLVDIIIIVVVIIITITPNNHPLLALPRAPRDDGLILGISRRRPGFLLVFIGKAAQVIVVVLNIGPRTDVVGGCVRRGEWLRALGGPRRTGVGVCGGWDCGGHCFCGLRCVALRCVL